MATATREEPTASFIGSFNNPVNAGTMTMPPPTPSSPARAPAPAPTATSRPSGTSGGIDRSSSSVQPGGGACTWAPSSSCRVTANPSATSPSGPAAGTSAGAATEAERKMEIPLKARRPAVSTIR